MDRSLASVFVNLAAADVWPQHVEEWHCLDMQSPADLKYNLMCAYTELRNTKAAAEADEKVQETKFCYLQELLSIIKKERDDARQECRKLQECLSQQQTSSSMDSPCSLLHSSAMVSSPSSPWSLQDLEEHLNSDNFCKLSKTPASIELQQTLQLFSQSCNDSLQALFLNKPTCARSLEDSEQQFSLDVLEQDLSFNIDPSFNLGDLEDDDQRLGVFESSQLTRSLSRQLSANSSSASVQMFQRQVSMDLADVSDPVVSPVTVIDTDAQGGAQMSGGVLHTPASEGNVAAVTGNLPLKSPPTSQLEPVYSAPCAEGSPGVVSTPYNTQTFAGSLTLNQIGNSNHVRQVHLPEPPEADPQVMLSSLPEKGKLLQAVMQAGPLLQTLLVAGPLPQWRHPPPALSTGDIPKVSMVPNNVILPYISHMPGPWMQGHVNYPMPMHRGGFLPVTRVCVANADPCSRTKKLRKLSPSSSYQNQFMPIKSGEGIVAGGVSHRQTIY